MGKIPSATSWSGWETEPFWWEGLWTYGLDELNCAFMSWNVGSRSILNALE